MSAAGVGPGGGPDRASEGEPRSGGLVREVRQVQQRLSAEETQVLLKGVVKHYGTQINEVLMAALWRAVHRVRGERGGSGVGRAWTGGVAGE